MALTNMVLKDSHSVRRCGDRVGKRGRNQKRMSEGWKLFLGRGDVASDCILV
jgi:hypothetical protein